MLYILEKLEPASTILVTEEESLSCEAGCLIVVDTRATKQCLDVCFINPVHEVVYHCR